MKKSEYKYKVTFLYPATPKALPIVNFLRNGNEASFYLKKLDAEIWEKLKKMAYSPQVHPCPEKKIVLKYSVKQFEDSTETWVERNLQELGIKN